MPRLIIDDSTPIEVARSGGTRGLIPRNYETHPVGCYTSATPMEVAEIPLIPRSEWVERIRDMEANKTRLSDIRRTSGPNGGRIPSLDQDGIGYCWNHSAAMAVMMERALRNLPYKRLSAFFVGCLIKNYRDEGGWGAQALDFIQEHGIPSVEFWPEKSMNRNNDTAACRENAKMHRVTEGWVDLSAAVYDRNLTEDQAMTLLLSRIPLIADFNWWGHSVCLLDPILTGKNGNGAIPDLGSLDFNNLKDLAAYASIFGKRGINSWTDDYGDFGEFELAESRAILNGGVAPRVSVASAV